MRWITTIFALIATISNISAKDVNYLQINDIALIGNNIVTSQKRDNLITLRSADGKKINRSWSLEQTPTGIAVDGDMIYATSFTTHGGVDIINSKKQKIIAHITTGSGACAPVVDRESNRLYVCNRFAATLSVIDLKENRVVENIALLREPSSAVYDKVRSKLYVANFLPLGSANVESIGASISVVDTKTLTLERNIELESGSNALRGIAISEDNDLLFTTHNLGRFQLPTTQLQQGWMNTSAMSVVDLNKMEFVASLLLDEPDRGAAGIWDVKCSQGKVVISHSGVHELSIVDYKEMRKRMESYPEKSELAYNLSFMEGIRRRVPIVGNAPRNICIEKSNIYVPTYFSDTLNILSLSNEKITSTVAMVDNRVVDSILLGEQYFNDAKFCFQNWQSCNGCHPGEGRTDGLNWDLINDGIGNSKNCKSLLFSHKTPPAMISGIRVSSYLAVRTGYKYIQFHQIDEEYAKCVDAYLLSLRPVPSPLLKSDGTLSAKAQRGKELFETLGCAKCHNGEYYTDGKMYHIGEDVEFDKGWDTPTLREVWRTAPYLFDGRAATMEELIGKYKHGVYRTLSEDEVKELAEFVNSL